MLREAAAEDQDRVRTDADQALKICCLVGRGAYAEDQRHDEQAGPLQVV